MKKKLDNILNIELDGMTTIGIVEETFFYEKEDYSGELYEFEIPVKNIQKIEFKKRGINNEKTKSNLIGDFFLTLIDSSTHPTQIEYNEPELNIFYIRENDGENLNLKIQNRNLTENIYFKIKSRIN